MENEANVLSQSLTQDDAAALMPEAEQAVSDLLPGRYEGSKLSHCVVSGLPAASTVLISVYLMHNLPRNFTPVPYSKPPKICLSPLGCCACTLELPAGFLFVQN